MADIDRVNGMRDACALFDGLPAAARFELADVLGKIGRDLLAAQRAEVPKDTGALNAGLTTQLLTEQLRVRSGLFGFSNNRDAKMNYHNLFYGLIVDKGRSAQTVFVERRRRVNGRLRLENGRSRKRLEDIVTTYALPVKAREAVPFVELNDDAVSGIADRRLQDFWDSVVVRAEGGS